MTHYPINAEVALLPAQIQVGTEAEVNTGRPGPAHAGDRMARIVGADEHIARGVGAVGDDTERTPVRGGQLVSGGEIKTFDFAKASVAATERHEVDKAQGWITGEQQRRAAPSDALHEAVVEDRGGRVGDDSFFDADVPPVQGQV